MSKGSKESDDSDVVFNLDHDNKKKKKKVFSDKDISVSTSTSEGESSDYNSKPSSAFNTDEDDPGQASQVTDEVELASDNFLFSRSGQGDKSGSVSLQEESDIILEAIRREILDKQDKLLYEEISKTLPKLDSPGFMDMDLTAIRSYLESNAGKKAVEHVMQDKDFRTALHHLEREGYGSVFQEFSSSFSNVKWQEQGENSQVRTSEVKNAEGEVIGNLTEKTIQGEPQLVQTHDDSSYSINQYRQINVPVNLNKGPLHISMAVQDTNGNNIAKDQAVYFTAHYNREGRLVEVSTPKPVEFSEGPNSVPYIMIPGPEGYKLYTLPVSKSMYEAMKEEVAINRVISMDSSKDLGEELATDQIVDMSSPGESRSKRKRSDIAPDYLHDNGSDSSVGKDDSTDRNSLNIMTELQSITAESPPVNYRSGERVDLEVAQQSSYMRGRLQQQLNKSLSRSIATTTRKSKNNSPSSFPNKEKKSRE